MELLETTEPLAYSYVENQRIHYIVTLPHYGEICLSTDLGYMLTDFPWFNSYGIAAACAQMQKRYALTKHFCQDPEVLVRILGQYLSREGYADFNFLVLFFLIAYMRILVDKQVDMRVLDPDDEEDRSDFHKYIEEGDPLELCDDETEVFKYISLVKSSADEQQRLIDATLDWLMMADSEENESLFQVFMRDLKTDDEFYRRYNTSFITVCRATVDEPEQYVQMTELHTIQDVIRHHLFQTICHGVKITFCPCCEHYFIPHKRSNAVYCDRPNPEYGVPCSKIGAQIAAQEKRDFDAATQIYHKAYKRMYQRMSNESIPYEEYIDWLEKAQKQKVLCENGEITLEAFKTWIDNTSRQKKKSN